MQRALATLLLVVALAACRAPEPAGAHGPQDRPVAFVHATVVSFAPERTLEDQTVVVRGGKIVQVGPSREVSVPAGAVRVDARGKLLMPGLVDFHVHLRDPSELLSYLAHGVTSVVHVSGPTGNVPDVLALRARIAAGEVAGPTVYSTGRILDGAEPVFPGVSTAVATAREARAAVSEQHRAGVDFVKVYNNLEPDALRAVTAEAHRLGLAVVGHVPRRPSRALALQSALEARLDVIAHSEELFFTYFYGDADARLDRGLAPEPDRSKIPEVVKWLRAAGTVVTPNLSFVAMTARQLESFDAVLADPEAKHLEPGVLEMWREQNPARRRDLAKFVLRERAKYAFLLELVRALDAGGVPLLLGTDASAAGMFPGASAHLELAELVKAGLTPSRALAAGTSAPAAFIRRHVRGAEPFGEVAAGHRADLVLLDADPRADVGNMSRIAGVMARGRWWTAEELRRMRAAATASFRR